MQQSREQDSFGTAPSADGSPNLGQVVLRRKWILAFFTGVGAALGYLYFTQQPAVYLSRVQLLVTQNRPALPTDSGAAAYEKPGDDLATQCLVATSPTVIASAVKTGDLAKRPEFGSPENAAALISIGLAAAPAELEKSDTSIMDISYRGRSPEECLAVVKAVSEAYRQFLGDSEQTVSKETATLVREAKEVLLADLARLDKEYSQFRAASPLLGQGPEKVNPHAVRLTQVESELTALLLQRSGLQSKIDAVRTALSRGGNREALALMVNQLREDGVPKSEAAAAAEKLFPLLLEKELLTENLGADHPKVQSIEKQIQLTRNHLTSLFDQTGAGQKPRDLLDVYMDSLGYEIEMAAVQEGKLREMAEAERGKAREFEAVLARDRELSREIGRKEGLLEAIVKRLDEMSLFDSQAIRTQLIAPAGPGARIPAKRNEYMAIGGVLGLILATALAYALEASDRSFRSPEDIREELNAPVVGHVPVITTKAAEGMGHLSPALCTVHTPKGQSAEAFRLVRTALFFGARGGNLRVIQVTSPDQGDGKSTVSSNLAIAIAQSGRRTLLVDADMRRPTVHRLFGVSNEVGLSGVIGAGAEPKEAILTTDVPNLELLPCGTRPGNPAELLSSTDFDRFLAWARDNYDFVIVDTPPLLAVSDPGTVASRVDAVMLALRLNKRARGKGAEAKQILEHVGANLIGVVINGVNAKGEYGYRASYRYTYSSGYRYGYSYTYGANAYTDESAAGRGRRAASTNGQGAMARVSDQA